MMCFPVTIIRDPYGFVNNISKNKYQGVVKPSSRTSSNVTQTHHELHDITDNVFIKNVITMLEKNNITVVPDAIEFIPNLALPDSKTDFITEFIDATTGNVKNMHKFKNRIMGLTSYFRSAQEELLPSFNGEVNIVLIPMSNYQFGIYETYRVDERENERRIADRDWETQY